jgi:hypothetical protein
VPNAPDTARSFVTGDGGPISAQGARMIANEIASFLGISIVDKTI